MAKNPPNRLHSLWPSQSIDENESVLPDLKRLAAKLEPAIENIGTAIGQYPRTSLTVAAALGAVAGWFIKRR